jgi:hypothetical protein
MVVECQTIIEKETPTTTIVEAPTQPVAADPGGGISLVTGAIFAVLVVLLAIWFFGGLLAGEGGSVNVELPEVSVESPG